MGASEPIPNPDNNPNVARWNAMAAAAARKRARFRHAMQSLPDGATIMMTASTLEAAERLLGAFPMGVSCISCERLDWTAAPPSVPAWPPEPWDA